MSDFRVFDNGTVWTISAVSKKAKDFANEHFTDVESWMGSPTHFTTDWRPARDLVAQLASEGFNIEA